jgi:hypothetical protein
MNKTTSRARLLKITLATAVALPTLAFAQTNVGTLDAYYIPSSDLSIDTPIGSADDSGDGFGVKGLFRFADTLGFVGEYQTVTYDDFDLDADQYRLGAGWFLPTTSGIYAEYTNIQLGDNNDGEADGVGVHGRIAGDLAPGVQVYGEAGYLFLQDDAEDIEGYEFLVGGAMQLNPQLGLFADYRLSNLEGQDSEAEFQFDDIRLGVRLYF